MGPGEVGRPWSWFVTSWTKGGGVVFKDPMDDSIQMVSDPALGEYVPSS